VALSGLAGILAGIPMIVVGATSVPAERSTQARVVVTPMVGRRTAGAALSFGF
jgi:hypothetical protein